MLTNAYFITLRTGGTEDRLVTYELTYVPEIARNDYVSNPRLLRFIIIQKNLALIREIR